MLAFTVMTQGSGLSMLKMDLVIANPDFSTSRTEMDVASDAALAANTDPNPQLIDITLKSEQITIDVRGGSIPGPAVGPAYVFLASVARWDGTTIQFTAASKDHGEVVSTWSSGTTYPMGSAVLFSSVYYLCIAANTNNQPDVSPTFWTAVTQHLAVASIHAIVGFALASNPPAWTSVDSYRTGAVVQVTGSFWLAVNQNINSFPNTLNTDWSLITTPLLNFEWMSLVCGPATIES